MLLAAIWNKTIDLRHLDAFNYLDRTGLVLRTERQCWGRRRQQWCDVHKHEHEHASQFNGMNEEQLRQWIITEATELGLGEVATALGGGARKTNGSGRG